MDGRVDFSALDRSRLLGALPSGSLGHLFTSGEPSTSSALSRLSAASAAAAAAASAGVTPSELPRPGSPSALQQYVGRFLPSGGLHSSGASYAMMAGYLANTGHIPDSLKHLMPEFQQYLASAAHSEGYARYLLNNMYYPYLPYLPATDTLSLFAQNSANAQVQAALQVHNAHHRIYDLQKEAIYNSGAVPRGVYPSHLFPSGSQIEATNLSLPSSSKSKLTDHERSNERGERADIKHADGRGRDESHIEKDSYSPDRKSAVDHDRDRHYNGDKNKSKTCSTEKTSKGFISKTDDKDKIKSSLKTARTDKYLQNTNQCNINPPRSGASSVNSRLYVDVETHEKDKTETETKVIKDMIDSACRERDRKRVEYTDSWPRHGPMVSPNRHERVISPDRRSSKAYSPVSKKVSPGQISLDVSSSLSQVQDVPENLCVKDKKWNKGSDLKHESLTSKGCIKTQSVVTGTTVTVTLTQNVITSEYTRTDLSMECHDTKGSTSPGSQHSPTHNKKATSTTYSLPYYHNLYARSTHDNKKVHAVTYVPEIGTISSPVAGAPSVINVIDTHSLKEHSTPHALNLTSSEGRHHKSKSSNVGAKDDEDKTDKKKRDKKKADEKTELDVISIDIDEVYDLSKSDSSGDKKRTESDVKASEKSCVQKSQDYNKSRHKRQNGTEELCSLSEKELNQDQPNIIIDVDKIDESESDSGKDTGDGSDKKPTDSVGSDKSVIKKIHSLDDGKESGTNSTGVSDNCKTVAKCDRDTDSDKGNKPSSDVNDNAKSKNKTNDSVKSSSKSSSSSSSSLLSSSTRSSSSPNTSAIDLSNDKRNSYGKGEPKETRSSNLVKTATSPQQDEDKSQFKKQTSPVKPLITRNSLQSVDNGHGGKDSPTKNGETSHKLNVSKHSDSQPQTSNQSIPVGIAVARQRSIAPKVPGANDKDGRKATEEAKPKSQSSDIKPIRPLKIIRPSTKGSTPTVTDKRNELPANLIVTGGSATQGVFWPDDPASRQLAAQVLQNSHQITPTTWYNPTQFSLPQNVATPTSDGNQSNQLPLTVPPGYKLAQDSLTGQILLIPTGTDVYDTSRVFGYPLGTQIHQGSTLVPPVITGQQNPSPLATTPNLFPGQHSIGDRSTTLDFSVPQFPQIYNANVLPSSEVAIKVDKGDHHPQQTTSSVVAPPIIIPSGQEGAAVPVNLNQDRDNEKEKIQPAIVTDISLASGQTFTFPTSNVPFVFNSNSLLQSQTVTDPTPDVGQLKQEQTTVQSRGTSPMLPATDSSAEDNEDFPTLAEVKSSSESEEIVQGSKTSHTQPEVENSLVICSSDLQTDKREYKNEVEDISVEADVVVGGCDSITRDCKTEEKEVTNNDPKVTDESCTDIKTGENSSVKSLEQKKAKSPSKKDVIVSSRKVTEGKNEGLCSGGSKPVKSDRNIFTDLTEYNPFTDPHVLQAADGLELLSTLAVAEKSSLKPNSKDLCTSDNSKAPTATRENDLKDDVYTFRDEHITISKSERKSAINVTDDKPVKEHNAEPCVATERSRSRVRCGHAFKPKKKEAVAPASPSPKRLMTFCGIPIPEDDDVIDSIEMEMKMRLAELQRRYREKQRELARLTPKRDKESDKDTEKSSFSSDKSTESKRGPGRPKKRKHNSGESRESASGKSTKKDGSHGPSQNGHKSHGLNKKKRMAELLVDRVFRKTGSSFKIPLSKKVNLIAPARIELPSASTSSVTDRGERSEPVHHCKPIDVGKLIKRSRFSQFGGKERGFVGGIWHKKEEKKKQKHSLFYSTNVKKKKKEKSVSLENGLGLLAEYATKTQSGHIFNKEEISVKRKNSDIPQSAASPESPNKKRKPGRPKKCDVIRPGITETLVAKQSKHIDFFRWQTEARKEEPKQERKISLEGKTPLKPLYLDEWNVRRSERIFLNDPSPQTSPNALSPDSKTKKDGQTKEVKSEVSRKHEQPKKSRSINLSQKLKRKYSTVITQQKSKYKTEQLKASRDQLTQSRKEQKRKRLSSGSGIVGGSDSEADDIPLSSLRPTVKDQATPNCVIGKDELKDEMRILVFMDGLFHEGELKAIRPPDIYGAILDNERKTRPHYFSQEEILKDAIKDVKPSHAGQLKEGTRICAYWSQQFSCLYPGTISRGSPNPEDTKDDLLNVEFDDGDTGKIPLDHIRIIPPDFPLVEYDPNPLLFLTKRRRTVSVSETSEPRKSVSNDTLTPTALQTKDKPKRGPGRPPKIDRLMSNESVGDEEVFVDEKKKSTECKSTKTKTDSEDEEFEVPTSRGFWRWSGSPTKRPGLKGKAKKEYYKTIVRGRESISVGESAVFLSIGRPNLPYVGRIESLWESWGGHMTVKVKWFYHPEETKGGKRLQNMKGALFRSDHEDDNDVQTISHKCDVIPYAEYRRRKDVISLADNDDVYYLAGSYQPTIGHITFEPGVLSN